MPTKNFHFSGLPARDSELESCIVPVMSRRAMICSMATKLAVIGGSAAAASPEPESPVVFKALAVGDTEAEVLRTLGVAPRESQRSELAGLEKLRLVFDLDQHRIEVTLIGGRLLSKSVTTKPSAWRMPW